MERAISKITDFELTKEQISNFVQQASEDAISGNYDLLKVYKSLTVIEKITEGIKKNVKFHVLDEAASYGKTFDHAGARFEVKYRKSYDYSEDSEVQRLEAELKERKELLKSIKKPIADPESGEIIHPAQEKQTEYITVKI